MYVQQSCINNSILGVQLFTKHYINIKALKFYYAICRATQDLTNVEYAEKKQQ